MIFIQHYIFMFLVLLVMFVYLMMDKTMRRVDGHLFRAIVALAMVLLINDLVFELLLGRAGAGFTVLLQVLLVLGYVLTVLIMLLWYYFVDFSVHHDTARLRRIYRVVAVPFMINIVFVFISIFTGFYYQVDALNSYSRGPGYVVFVLIAGFYLVLAFYQVIKHRRRFHFASYYALLGFMLPIIVAGIIQSVLFGLLIFMPALVLTLLMVFIFIQAQKHYLDHVTEVFNLKEYERFLREHNNRVYADASFAAMIVQFDFYQQMLIEHSYADADKAMKLLANGLKAVLHPLDFIARIDARRFVVLLYAKQQRKLSQIKTDYDAVMAESIAKENISFAFDYSVVSGLYNKRKHGKIEALVADLTLTLQAETDLKSHNK